MPERVHEEDAEWINHLNYPWDERFVGLVCLLEV